MGKDSTPYVTVRLRENGSVMFTFANTTIGNTMTTLDEVELTLEKGELTGQGIARTSTKQQVLARGILALGNGEVTTVTVWSSQLLVAYRHPITEPPEKLFEHKLTERITGFVRRTGVIGLARVYLPDHSVVQ